MTKPWRIETDWTVEVVDADGNVIEKFQTRKEAEEFLKQNANGFCEKNKHRIHCNCWWDEDPCCSCGHV